MTVHHKTKKIKTFDINEIKRSDLVREVLGSNTRINHDVLNRLMKEGESEFMHLYVGIVPDSPELTETDKKLNINMYVKDTYLRFINFACTFPAEEIYNAFFDAMLENVGDDIQIVHDDKQTLLYALWVSEKMLQLELPNADPLQLMACALLDVTLKIVEPKVQNSVSMEIAASDIISAVMKVKEKYMQEVKEEDKEKPEPLLVDAEPSSVKMFFQAFEKGGRLAEYVNADSPNFRSDALTARMFHYHLEGFLSSRMTIEELRVKYRQPILDLYNLASRGIEKDSVEFVGKDVADAIFMHGPEKYLPLLNTVTSISLIHEGAITEVPKIASKEQMIEFFREVSQKLNEEFKNDPAIAGRLVYSLPIILEFFQEKETVELFATTLAIHNAVRDIAAREGKLDLIPQNSHMEEFVYSLNYILSFGLLDMKTGRVVNDEEVFNDLNIEFSAHLRFSKVFLNSFVERFGKSEVSNEPAEVQENKTVEKTLTQPPQKGNLAMTPNQTNPASMPDISRDHSNDALAQAFQAYRAEQDNKNGHMERAIKDVVLTMDGLKDQVRQGRDFIDRAEDRFRRLESKVFNKDELDLIDKFKAESLELRTQTKTVVVNQNSPTDEVMKYVGYTAVGGVIVGGIGYGIYKIFFDDNGVNV